MCSGITFSALSGAFSPARTCYPTAGPYYGEEVIQTSGLISGRKAPVFYLYFIIFYGAKVRVGFIPGLVIPGLVIRVL